MDPADTVGEGPAAMRERCTPKRRKTSHSLCQANVSLLVNAIRHAENINCQFNRFMTIDWDLAGVVDPWEAQGKLIKYIRDWLKKRGIEFAYIWVMERGERLGLHSHILLHIPPHLIGHMKQLLPGWKKSIGLPRRKPKCSLNSLRIFDSRPIGHTYAAAFAKDAGKKAYEVNLAVLIEYVLKGAAPLARRAFNLTRLPQYGEVTGQRCGTSRNLGVAALAQFRTGLRKAA